MASSPDEEDKDTLRVAFCFPFQERGMRQRKTMDEGCETRDWTGEGGDIYMIFYWSSQVL